MDTFSEKISPGKNLLVGFQHVLAMCPGTIAVPLILSGAMGLDARTTAFLVSANLFTSGIAILIQVFGLSKYIGSRYPIILGSSFAPLAPHDYDWKYLRPSHPVWSHYGIRCTDLHSFLFSG